VTRGRLAVAAAALVAAGPTAAFVGSTTESGKQLFWPSRTVTYLVNAPATDRISPSCAADGSGPAVAAVAAGFAQWEQPCTDLRLVNGGPTDVTDVGLLGQSASPGHIVVFREGWCSVSASANCFDDPGGEADWSTVALTTVLYEVSTGRIMDADIEMNGWDGASGLLEGPPTHGWYFTCSDPPVGGPCNDYGDAGCFYMDLLNTVTHEAGHFIGLSHPCNGGAEPWLPACNASHQQTTMYPGTRVGEIAMRDLSADDVNGVCSIYPLGSAGPSERVTAPADDDDGCGCGSTGPASLAPFLVLALALRRRPLRRR
jgi:uncharacterized protein (TIGR03382 family)